MNKEFKLHQHLTLNRIGYGAMRITGPGIWGPPVDREQAIQVLKRALELGVNFIDTADAYGPDVNEELIAAALYPYPAELVIATKGGFMRSGPNQWHMNGHPDHLKKALEGSLKRLKKERIQLYQLHRIDPAVPRNDTFQFLRSAKDQGLIDHIGLSEVSIEEIKAASEYFEVVSVQNKYSFDFRKWEPELNFCRENGIAFIPWNPINANNVDSMKALQGIAAKHGRSPQQIALNWLLQHSENILLIPGTSKLKHLEENMQIADFELDAADLEILNLKAPTT